MSFWDRFRRRFRGDGAAAPSPDEPPAASAPAPRAEPAVDAASSRPAEIDRLERVGQATGATVAEAIATLRRLRGTAREAEALEALLGAGGKLPDDLTVACAEMLAARGDEARALGLLARTTATAGLVLAADLWAATGQLAKAAGTIERVLARDIDAPGARERHARWRQALGFSPIARARLDEATMVTAKPESGSFRLLREVARGGAGTVYEAEDAVLGRRVAFKVYHRGAEDRALLAREVRIAASLAGPAVIRLYDASPDDGWLAMEWVRRGSLRDLLKADAFAELWPVWRWVRPLARGIARIHERGVVHGDVKPANVLMRAADDPVLGDFGISRAVGDKMAGGSPGYMSPERLAGAASDPADDVYGFGRVVEDVLVRASDAAEHGRVEDRAGDREAAAKLALLCLAPAPERPANGGELCRWLEDLHTTSPA